MKILIADKFAQSGIDEFQQLGCEVAFEPDTTADQLAARMAELSPNVLIVRSTKVSPESIQSAANLSLIVRAGAGYDTIDVAEASRRGVFVANCPGKNSVAVAEVAWGLILACDRRIPDQTADLRAGKWDKKGYSKAKGLKGRTLGVIGTGKIGMEIAKRGKAFDMNVVAWSRSLTPEKAEALGVGYCESLTDLAAQSDAVSVSVSANAQTKEMINVEFVSAMKENAIFVNTSRGSVVDHDALANGIRDKNIRAGLDVFNDEPGSSDKEFSNPIIELPGVFGTHHVGASTDQAQSAIGDEAVRVVRAYMESGQVPNCVNLASGTPATFLLTVRHLNQPGVLSHVFEVIGGAKINVEEMENIIYDGAEAACAKIQLDDNLAPDHLEKIKQNSNVLSIEQAQIQS